MAFGVFDDRQIQRFYHRLQLGRQCSGERHCLRASMPLKRNRRPTVARA
jgi:hypothetical protein